MSMQAPRAVLHSSASAPRFLDTFGTSSTRLQHLPRGFRAFLICSASLRDVRNASRPSAHFPDAFTKFRDTVCSAEAFGTTHRRCRRFPEGADVRDDVQTTARSRCRRCAEFHFRFQILHSQHFDAETF